MPVSAGGGGFPPGAPNEEDLERLPVGGGALRSGTWEDDRCALDSTLPVDGEGSWTFLADLPAAEPALASEAARSRRDPPLAPRGNLLDLIPGNRGP
jgi:hypothetical protein